MKTKLIIAVLCLVFLHARAEEVKPFIAQPTLMSVEALPPPPPGDPPMFSCIMTFICAGIFVLCVYACWYNGMTKMPNMTNAPPEEFPTNNPVDPTDTNGLPTNIYPAMARLPLSANGAFSYSDCSTQNWKDPHGAIYQTIRSTTIQSSPDLVTWTNYLGVMAWESQAGCAVVLSDWRGAPVWTNYATRTGDGGTTNNAPHWLVDLSDERKFFRCTP